ncbi:PREDICTED: sperm flagellar protein 1-like [Amphimedon queenslandica]|uniref:Calponin-homology (CH) domain-containing protein n=1 Tax=Amphimedon queenslandica TaxID=400682 RepID=A0A1X7UDK4_AMPQE|nr:PREDICTED: sperm flagellar protein 1-like [Amphimedon queenslandica]|eukprot:XP_019855022.1 PREDICTED: sperm flagellar protein 1-like [Amphimedon queenslandica]
MGDPVTQEDKQQLYAWIDEVPLSRQKKNISRDFSDGVMAAELAQHFFPNMVELHNYPPANSTTQKLTNWRTLNRKVFMKLGFDVPDPVLQEVVASKPGVIEYILNHFKKKIEQVKAKEAASQISVFPRNYEDVLSSGIQQALSHQHSITSPTHSTITTHLPPIVNSHGKPSQIPRPIQSGDQRKSHLPPVNNQVAMASYPQGAARGGGGGGQQIHRMSEHSKLPAIKDTSKKKYYSGSRESRINVDSHAALNSGLAIAEKDQIIMELQETIQLLTMKVNRLEHLIRVKDIKIQEMEKIMRK